MPIILPDPYPSETSADPKELYRFLRSVWKVLQQFRAGSFQYSTTVPANDIRRVTYTDPADPKVDNFIVGMAVFVSPPPSISGLLQVDYAFVPAVSQLTLQLRNATAAPIAVSGLWSYLAFIPTI